MSAQRRRGSRRLPARPARPRAPARPPRVPSAARRREARRPGREALVTPRAVQASSCRGCGAPRWQRLWHPQRLRRGGRKRPERIESPAGVPAARGTSRDVPRERKGIVEAARVDGVDAVESRLRLLAVVLRQRGRDVSSAAARSSRRCCDSRRTSSTGSIGKRNWAMMIASAPPTSESMRRCNARFDPGLCNAITSTAEIAACVLVIVGAPGGGREQQSEARRDDDLERSAADECHDECADADPERDTGEKTQRLLAARARLSAERDRVQRSARRTAGCGPGSAARAPTRSRLRVRPAPSGRGRRGRSAA